MRFVAGWGAAAELLAGWGAVAERMAGQGAVAELLAGSAMARGCAVAEMLMPGRSIGKRENSMREGKAASGRTCTYPSI